MEENFTTNIRVFPLNDERLDNLSNVRSYLKKSGKCNYSSVDNPDLREYSYKQEKSSVFIREFPRRADIRINSPTKSSLNRMRVDIERILEGKIIN